MAALILPSSSPPMGPAPVNWANPITRGLVIAYFASSNFDHAGTRVPNNTDKTNNQQSANQYGAAMRFTGSQAVNTLTIDHKVTHNLSSATAMTVVTVTTAAAGAERPICGVWGSTLRWYMGISSSGYPLFAVNGGATNRVYTSNLVTAFDHRTSLAAVWDGSSDTCKLYKAGAEISGGKSGTAQTAIGSHTMGPSIGSQSTGGAAKHSGTIEYVLVFNRALSAAEIRSISENPYQLLLSNTLPIYADIVSGLTSVSSDKSLIYNLLHYVQQDKSIEWNTLNSINKDDNISWHINTSVTSDKTFSWDALNQVIADKVIEWNLEQYVQSDKGMSWDILNNVVSDVILSWNTTSSVTTDINTTWNIISSVFVDKTINYDILISATKDESISWDISQFAFADKGLTWDIESTMLTAFADIPIRYDIVNSVYSDFNSYWDLLQTTFSDKSFPFDILNNVMQDQSIAWGISEVVVNDLIITSNLLSLASGDIVLAWNSAGVVGNNLVINYTIQSNSTSNTPSLSRTITISLADRSINIQNALRTINLRK